MFAFIQNILSQIVVAIGAILGLLGLNEHAVYEAPLPHVVIEETAEIELKNTGEEILPEEKFGDQSQPPKTLEEPTSETIPIVEETPEIPQRETITAVKMPLPEVLIDPTILNQKVREAVVNIFCLSQGGGFARPGSASGVIIDGRGVILTNAHVAQYFLIKNYPSMNYIDCVIRTGSPAEPAYRGELLFIPPVWVEENKQSLKLTANHSVGEHDYALIRITEPINNASALPDTFPFISPDTGTFRLRENEPLMVASYPAGFLSGISITKDLWLTSSVSQIIDIYTFRDGAPNVIAVKGVPGAQEGSSGGAFVDFVTGKLLGIITTRTAGETTGERELRALSLNYINEDFRENTGETLEKYISGDIKEKAFYFGVEVAPRLREIIIGELDK